MNAANKYCFHIFADYRITSGYVKQPIYTLNHVLKSKLIKQNSCILALKANCTQEIKCPWTKILVQFQEFVYAVTTRMTKRIRLT